MSERLVMMVRKSRGPYSWNLSVENFLTKASCVMSPGTVT